MSGPLVARFVDGDWVVEIIRKQREFSREEAAVALDRRRARRPIGAQTIRRAVQAEAARTPGGRRADPERVAAYRAALTDALWSRVAKVREPGKPATVAVNLTEQYKLDEAAALLTIAYPERPVQPGHRTAQDGLGRATRSGLQAPAVPDPDEFDFWRELLIRELKFPRP